jgi:flagellar basal body-associated protein FliL
MSKTRRSDLFVVETGIIIIVIIVIIVIVVILARAWHSRTVHVDDGSGS